VRPLECEVTGPRLFTRAEALAILKIGETTLFWLQRTGKLRPIRIGRRVLYNATEIERFAIHGATLTEAEKKQTQTANAPSNSEPRGRRARAPEAPARQPRRGDGCSP